MSPTSQDLLELDRMNLLDKKEYKKIYSTK
jgi:hypothetical protein